MTDKAWVLLLKAVVKGYRSIPFVRGNQQWMMIELLNGFGSHGEVLEAHELRSKFLVLSAKEESNTSHANQGYNQFVAKEEKSKSYEPIYTQRRITHSTKKRAASLSSGILSTPQSPL